MTEEDLIQEEIVLWFRQKYQFKGAESFAILFAVPNGGYRSPRQGKILKSTGVLAGVTDLILVHSEGVEFIELKTETGTLQASQKVFKKMLSMVGMADRWHLVRSLDEFKLLTSKLLAH